MIADEWLDRIDELLDVEDPADPERIAFEAHLVDCPECRAEVEAYRKLRRLALAVPPVPIPDDLGYRIRRRLDEARAGGAPRAGRLLRWRPWFGATAAAAVLLAAVVTGLHFLSGDEPPRGDEVRVAAERPAESPAPVKPPRPDPAPAPVPSAGDPARALGDFLVQAAHAAPADLARLKAEAANAALLPRIREAAAMAGGAERRFLTAGADLLVQLDNSEAVAALAAEAHLVLAGRPR